MDPDIPPEKMRCMVVKPDLNVPGCVCVPEPEESVSGELEETKPETGTEEIDKPDKPISVTELTIEETKSTPKDTTVVKEAEVVVFEIVDDRSQDLLPPVDSDDGITNIYEGKYLLDIPCGEVEFKEDYTKMSELSRDEGEIFEDYMRFFIEGPCVPLPDSISSSEASCMVPVLQRTVAIVRPDAMIYKDVILRAIFEAGFQVLWKRVIHLTPEQVSEIYAKNYGSPSFPHLVVSVSAGPILVMCLTALDVISRWKKMVGPDGSISEEWFFPISMRKRFGLQGAKGNSLHASNGYKESNRENTYFCSETIMEPISTDPSRITDYYSVHMKPTLLNGLAEVVKKKPMDPILFLADWLLMNNPYQPRMPYAIAVTPT